jgi:hypothetical protein
MRIPRFTVGRLMMVVAILAVGLWFGLTWKRSADYRRLAEFYAHQEGVANVRAGNVEKGLTTLPGYSDDERRRFVASGHRVAAHFASLKRKYHRAARIPWLPIPADPPAPQ